MATQAAQAHAQAQVQAQAARGSTGNMTKLRWVLPKPDRSSTAIFCSTVIVLAMALWQWHDLKNELNSLKAQIHHTQLTALEVHFPAPTEMPYNTKDELKNRHHDSSTTSKQTPATPETETPTPAYATTAGPAPSLQS
eukprot:gene22408-8919_t